MQTLKTAVVVVLLLVVFYGVYEMLNRPPAQPPDEVAGLDSDSLTAPNVEIPTFGTPEPYVSVPSGDATNDLASPVPPPSQYELPDAADSPDQGFDSSNRLPVQPPSLPGSGGPLPSVAPSGSSGVGAIEPGGSQLQHNPYIHNAIQAEPTDQSVASSIGVRAYARAKKLAETQIENGRYHDALNGLSIFYKSQDLSAEEQSELLRLLDPLAAKVVYSTEHLVQPAHQVRRNETLMDIGQAYDVPWRLLQKINGIENPRVLLPGSEIKVVSGPFRAEVDLQDQELTIFLGGLYAGRFPISVGSDLQPTEGRVFTVRDKVRDRDYFTAQGRKIPAGDPSNPFGDVWMDLGHQLSIHGSPTGGQEQPRGCIGLSPRDADDVYSILSVGSNVRIYR